MNKDEINQRFKKVRDGVDQLFAQQQQEIVSKANAIRDDAAKKLQNVVS